MLLEIIKRPLRKIRQIIQVLMANPCSSGVVQIFVNDKIRSTNYSITNFPSLLLPNRIGRVWYEIALFDEKGSLCLSKSIEIPKFGSAKINPADYFTGTKIPERGLFQANLMASKFSLLNKYYLRLLGKMTSHFYTFFYSPNHESLAMIHPQTTAPVKDTDEKSNYWYSQYLIYTPPIDHIEIYQLNPCKASYELNLKLVNLKGEIVAESTELVPGYGTRKIIWEKSKFLSEEYLYLASDTLRGNEKPILFSFYPDGSFTALHT